MRAASRTALQPIHPVVIAHAVNFIRLFQHLRTHKPCFLQHPHRTAVVRQHVRVNRFYAGLVKRVIAHRAQRLAGNPFSLRGRHNRIADIGLFTILRADLQANIAQRRTVLQRADHEDMLRHQACGKHAAGLFFRRDGGHVAHDAASFTQRTEEGPVSGFERGAVKPGSSDRCHCYAISSEHGLSL